MRWILRSLAIAIASVLLFGGANKPAYAQLDTGMQSTLNAALASGNATVIAIVMANAAASGNQAAMNAVAAAVIGSGNPSLIASVIGSNLIAGGAGGAAIGTALAGTGNATLIGQVIAAAPPAAANNVISVVGAAVAGSANATTDMTTNRGLALSRATSSHAMVQLSRLGPSAVKDARLA